MPVIQISDFSGGRDTTSSPLLATPNICVSASKNVWAPRGALVKIPGVTVNASFTATGGAMASIYADSTINTAMQIYCRIATSAGSTYGLWAGQIGTDSLTPLGYTTGTISVSGAVLISATGSGTTWLTHVSAGDFFRANSTAGSWYPISSVQDDTHLTLSTAVPVAVATGSAYTVLTVVNKVQNEYASLAGSLWMSDLGSTMQRYDGTGVTRIPAGPTAAFIETHKNYMFGFRTTTADSRLYWSTVKDPTSWPTNNFIDIDKSNGKGAGLISYGNELICFKTTGMYKVVGEIFEPTSPTYAVYPISVPSDFRFNCAKSAVIHNGILYFICLNGIYQYQQGTFYIQKVSDIIRSDLPTGHGDVFDDAANSTTYIGSSFDGYLIFKGLLTTGGSPGGGAYYALIMDRKGAWWLIDGTGEQNGHSDSAFSYIPLVTVPKTSGQPVLITGGTTYPRLYSWDVPNATSGGSVAGTFQDAAAAVVPININGVWLSKEFNIEFGHFKEIVVYLKKQSTGSLTLGWSVDQQSQITTTLDMTQGRGNMIRYVIPVNQKGSTIQIQLSQSGQTVPFEIYAANIYYDQNPNNRQV